MAKIILLILQIGIIGFVLFYALPRVIKSRQEFKKHLAVVRAEMEETKKLRDLCIPIFQGRATDADIAAFQAHRKKWEEKHGRVERPFFSKDFS